MPPHIAQIQKTQAKPPSLAGIHQPDQQTSDFFVFGAQLRAIAKTGLADPKGPAGQGYADPVSRHRIPGHLAALRWPIYFFPRASLSSSFCMLSSQGAFNATVPPLI